MVYYLLFYLLFLFEFRPARAGDSALTSEHNRTECRSHVIMFIRFVVVLVVVHLLSGSAFRSLNQKRIYSKLSMVMQAPQNTKIGPISDATLAEVRDDPVSAQQMRPRPLISWDAVSYTHLTLPTKRIV